MTIAGEPAPTRYTIDDASTDLVIPVIGLYPDTDNAVTLTLENLAGDSLSRQLTVSTPPLPDYFPDISIDEHTALAADGLIFADFAWGQGTRFFSKPMAFDSAGNVRWWLDMADIGRLAAPFKFTDRDTLIIGAYETVREYALTGRLIREVSFPGYVQHHEVLEKPNGNLLIAVNKTSEDTVEDHIIEVTWSGDIVNEWDLRPLLDRYRSNLQNNGVDWFHMNSIFFDEADGSLIVSGRNQGVIKLAADGELVWILAPHDGWGKAGEAANGPDTASFLLTAVDADGSPYPADVQSGHVLAADFDFPWGQHAAMIQEDGHLILFDNGFNRRFNLPHNDYSRAVEYRIDESTLTVEQIWQYGLERGIDLYSPIVSDVDILPNGNRLMTSGISFAADPPRARISEVTYPEKIVAFEATLSFRNTASTNSFAWGDLDLVYRAEKRVLFGE